MSDIRSLENLFQLVYLLKRQYHSKLEQLDIGITPMHMRVLKVINKTQQCTAIDVSGILDRDKSQVTRLLNALITEGLVAKEPNPGDKRSHYLCLTATGKKIIEQISDIDIQMSELVTKDLSPDELAEFQRITRKMAESLNF